MPLTPVEYLAQLLRDCRTSDGVLRVELIECALASAYRAGFHEALERMPRPVECSVAPPHWPLDEGRVAAMEARIREELGLPKR